MISHSSLHIALQNAQVDPALERFLGCIVLERVGSDVAKAVDAVDLRDVPAPLQHLVQIWQGRNHASEAQADVIQLLRDTLKDMVP